MTSCPFCGERVDNDKFCCHSCGNPLPLVKYYLKNENEFKK